LVILIQFTLGKAIPNNRLRVTTVKLNAPEMQKVTKEDRKFLEKVRKKQFNFFVTCGNW
jgi:hypothetical protein